MFQRFAMKADELFNMSSDDKGLMILQNCNDTELPVFVLGRN